MNFLSALPTDLKKNVLKYLPVGPRPKYLDDIEARESGFRITDNPENWGEMMDILGTGLDQGRAVLAMIGYRHEWFWVQVTEVGNTTIVGEVENVFHSPFESGQRLRFNTCNVLTYRIAEWWVEDDMV